MSTGIVSPNLQGPYKVRDLIITSYQLAHVLGIDESLSPVKAGFAFRNLNKIIERASLTKLFALYETGIEVPLQPDQVAYTIGPPTVTPPPDVLTVRPVEVLSGYSRYNGQDIPVFVTHAKQDYDRIPLKTLQASNIVREVYYQASFPAGTLYVYPTPTDTNISVFLTVKANVSPFVFLDEEVSLPPGYLQYLEYSLAKQVAAAHGIQFGDENAQILEEVRVALHSNNIKPLPVSSTGLVGLTSTGSGYNIFTDQSGGR